MLRDFSPTNAAAVERTLREGRGHGFLGVELEARLTLAELARKTGHVGSFTGATDFFGEGGACQRLRFDRP